MRHLGEATGIACALTSADRAKIVARTAGYSGSDMRALIQEACQVSSARHTWLCVLLRGVEALHGARLSLCTGGT